MKLLLLRCPKCNFALSPGQDDQVVQCPNCRGAVAIHEGGLALLAAQYVRPTVETPPLWLPFWVYRGKVTIKERKTQGGRSAEKDAPVYLLSFPKGGGLMIVLVLVVAAADIGAYFAGRAWGNHKLAPVVSPAKTWEGFWGGVLACCALALLLWSQLPNQQAHISLAAVVTVIITMGLASVVGDLTVSMVKRESGVKDSGSLLPGHGGVLDRLDSICAAAPVFALGLLLADW